MFAVIFVVVVSVITLGTVLAVIIRGERDRARRNRGKSWGYGGGVGDWGGDSGDSHGHHMGGGHGHHGGTSHGHHGCGGGHSGCGGGSSCGGCGGGGGN
ncbi:hypothetical protein [Nocardia tengchongensis]|uniref:hypothetical protein n=1 Tax=Nocardia tengchongensis TaxID=2055889 RepID=UPI0036771B8F